jgi:ankyrin repeat protein
VRALIELGADVNKAADNGGTPLFIAAEVGHEAVVRALIKLVRTSTRRGMTAGRRCLSPLKLATRR